MILYIWGDCTSSYSLPTFTVKGKGCFPSYFPVCQGSPVSQACMMCKCEFVKQPCMGGGKFPYV